MSWNLPSTRDHAQADADHKRALIDHAGRFGWREVGALFVAAMLGFGGGVFVHNGNPGGASGASVTTGLKAPLTGLLDRQGPPKLSFMTGYVVNVDWSALQSSASSPLLTGNPIDKAVASAGSRGLRIRLFMNRTNSWVQSLGGAPVTVVNSQGPSCQVGHYWTPAYAAAYQDLQTKLAAKYDSVPAVREVTLSMATLCYSEPLLRYSWPNLVAAGDTLALDEASYTTMIQAHRVWQHTLQDFAFNPSNMPGAGGEAFTVKLINDFRTAFGAQGVLENNSLRAGGSGSTYAQMYATMKALGHPISFQTATIQRMGDPAATFKLAESYGAHSVELPSGYTSFPASVLAAAQAALSNNP